MDWLDEPEPSDFDLVDEEDYNVKTIWKFQLNVAEWNHIFMPEDADIIDIQVQRGMPVIWAIVDPNAPPEQRVFRTYATGEPTEIDMPNDDLGDGLYDRLFIHRGTYQLQNGDFVGHVFEVV